MFFIFLLTCACFCCVFVKKTKATKAAKQIPSGLKSKISYTPEDAM
jgi:hypothetical protein